MLCTYFQLFYSVEMCIRDRVRPIAKSIKIKTHTHTHTHTVTDFIESENVTDAYNVLKMNP